MSVPVALEAREIVFGYDKRHTLLDGWSAQFPYGQMTALTGPSGRGKSTLLYLLGLMLQPRSGEVVVDGQPASTGSDANRAHLRADRFGFVFQDAALDPTRTVIDNITETTLYRPAEHDGLAKARRRGVELMGAFGVGVAPYRTPGQVSGGQAQRIALCRALLHDPAIILADEPTGNLDPATAAVVVGALRERADAGAAVVVVTHSPEVAAACDREIGL